MPDLSQLYSDYEASKMDAEAKGQIANDAAAKASEKKNQLIEAMKELGFAQFKTMDGTTVFISKRSSYSIADERALKEYLKKKRMVKEFYYEHLDKARLNMWLTQQKKKLAEENKILEAEGKEPKSLVDVIGTVEGVDPETGEIIHVPVINESVTQSLSTRISK